MIRLDAYTSHVLEHLTKGGAWALYVIRPTRSQRPVKIGKTTDPAETLYRVARHNPVPIEMRSLLWSCGRPLAERIDRVVRLELEADGKASERGWYRLSVDEMAKRIEETAHRLYPSVKSFLDHAGMVELLARRGSRIGLSMRPPRLAVNPLFK
jgi:hypothetical protein